MNNRKIALLAALPAAVLLANNAMAGVDVYGKVNISLQKNSVDNNNGTVKADIYDNYTLESNASRIGFKASTDLGDTGLKGVAKMEYETDVDNGSTAPLAQRNIYAGVQGGFGTLIAGKFDTPMKESQGKVDMFNDYNLGDIKTVLVVGENRADNIVMYSTPKMDNGMAVNVAFMPGEDTGATGADKNSGAADAISASVTYDSESLYLALAHDTASPATATVSGAEITRVVGQLKMDAFTVGAIYQKAEAAKNSNVAGITTIATIGAATKGPFGTTPSWSQAIEDQDGYILSGSFTMGNDVIKAEYGSSSAGTSTANDGDVDITQMSIGYDHKLGKDAMVFAFYTDYSAEHKTAANVKRELNSDVFGVGYELKF